MVGIQIIRTTPSAEQCHLDVWHRGGSTAALCKYRRAFDCLYGWLVVAEWLECRHPGLKLWCAYRRRYNSEVVAMLRGEHVPKSEEIRRWVAECMHAAKMIRDLMAPREFRSIWIPRRLNKVADMLANECMDLMCSTDYRHVSLEWLQSGRNHFTDVHVCFDGGSRSTVAACAAVLSVKSAGQWFTVRSEAILLGHRSSIESECIGMRLGLELIKMVVADIVR